MFKITQIGMKKTKFMHEIIQRLYMNNFTGYIKNNSTYILKTEIMLKANQLIFKTFRL